MNIDSILERFNLKYDDLNTAEQETLEMWTRSLSSNQISVEIIKKYIDSMKTAVEEELASVSHNNKQDIFLKARLRNYILLRSFLETPDKAKESLEKMLSGIVPRKS